MYEYNEHINKETKNSSNNPLKIDKKFLDELSKFIQSVESEMDIMLPGSASLKFLWYYKIIDYIISQKLAKNIIIRLLCPLDENSVMLTKQLVPFVGYRSINLSLPNTSSNSLFFIRDNQDIFSFSIEMQREQQQQDKNKDNDTIFSVNNWSYSNDISIVRNVVYCFDIIWEEKENHDKTIKEKRHSELLFDLISHDIGNYHQTIQGSLDIITSLFKRNNNDNNPNALSQNNERIISFLTTAKKALNKSQLLVDNIRRLERLYGQKELKLTLKNLPDAINNAYTTVDQTLYDNNPQGKRIKFSINVVGSYCTGDINVIAEDLLEEIFVNLFSNSVKYTDSSEVKIDVVIRDYFIGEVKYWMITVSDYGKGIPDLMKKGLFERFYSNAKGSGLGLSIVRTLAERYKGKIWVGDRVYEDYSKGTTFGMIFPVAEQRE
ncbi:MAG TPA: HAMP domain-containing sensor histidine kinase [Nitrososphaeraceae archaeon]|nr:HAMP domain-containing sensor histidine kinase [Nitrososphaeraceae archaeon]